MLLPSAASLPNATVPLQSHGYGPVYTQELTETLLYNTRSMYATEGTPLADHVFLSALIYITVMMDINIFTL